MRRAAPEIERLAAADLKREECTEVATEDHPDRTRTANGEGQRDARGHDLSQQKIPKAARHDRRQREHY